MLMYKMSTKPHFLEGRCRKETELGGKETEPCQKGEPVLGSGGDGKYSHEVNGIVRQFVSQYDENIKSNMKTETFSEGGN